LKIRVGERKLLKGIAREITLTLLLMSMLTLTFHFQPTTQAHALSTLAVDKGIDVWMQYPTPFGGQGLNQSADLVLPQQKITLTAYVIYNYLPVSDKNVTFQVFDNKLNLASELKGVTGDAGRTSVVFQMPWLGVNPESLFGLWRVIASVNVSDITLHDEMDFYYDYLVHIWSATTNKVEYEHLETARITVTFGTHAEQSYNVSMTAVVRDNLEVPVGIATLDKTIGGTAFGVYKNYTNTVSILIPYWAYAGSAEVRVNFFNKSPIPGGASIIAPEKVIQIWILPSVRTIPTADFTWGPLEPRIRRSVTYNASTSLPGWSLPDLAPTPIIKYVWNFGDNMTNYTITDPYIEHIYNEPGRFTVTLTVVDNASQKDSISQEMKVIAIADVAIANVTLSKTVVGQNYTISVKVITKNEGDLTQTYTITAYADLNTKIVGDEITVETRNITLPSGDSTTIILTWNTTGVAKGNYTISAYAIPVPGETDISNNKFTGGWVVVAMVGDVTGRDGWPDGRVDIRDLAVVAKFFGAVYPDTRYNPNYDVNYDGKIDLRDIAITAKNFGKTNQ